MPRHRKDGDWIDKDLETPDSQDIYSPTIRLIASILKVAKDDWYELAECPKIITTRGKIYVDKEHKSICDKSNFESGREELLTFFYSEWFEKICDEIGFSPEKTRAIIGIN